MADDVIIVFSPEGLTHEEYKKKYPELDSIPEFKAIKLKELIWVLYYSNPTSFLLYQLPEKKDRALQAATKAFGNANQAITFVEDYFNRRLQNQTKIDEAIRRMEKVLPTVRFQAMEMANKCFDDLNDLLSLPLKKFEKPDGTVDYNAYMAIRKSVLKELKELVELREIGFGITNKEENKIDGHKIVEGYLKNKRVV